MAAPQSTSCRKRLSVYARNKPMNVALNISSASINSVGAYAPITFAAQQHEGGLEKIAAMTHEFVSNAERLFTETNDENADISCVDSSKSAILLHEELAAANIRVKFGLKPREFERQLSCMEV